MTNFAAGIFNSLSDELRATPQPDKWHGEGDVYTHTNMVCDALRSMPDYQKLPETQQDLLLAAAQLHDIGKIPTTIIAKTKRATFQNETSKTSLFSLPFFSWSFDRLNIN